MNIRRNKMKITTHKLHFARYSLALLILAVLLAQFPVQVLAKTVMLNQDEVVADEILPVPAKDPNFRLADNHETINNGPQNTVNTYKTYYCENSKLYAETNGIKTIVAECAGDNITISNGKLYFTEFDNADAKIKTVDLESREISTVLDVGRNRICQFYIVNDERMMYLSGGVVYSCLIGDRCPERISPMDNVFNFLPTDSGTLFAVGELFNYSVSLDNVHLLDKVSYYTVDLTKDYFVATVDYVLLQIPMDKVRGFCSKALNEKMERTADLLPYMTEYDLYGTYDAVDLLRLDDEDRSCEYCDSADGYVSCEKECNADVATPRNVEVCSTVPLSNTSTMIMSQSNSLTGFMWIPKANVRKYGSTNSFVANIAVTGIPYARPGAFDNTLKPYMKYIVFGAGNPGENDMWTYMSLASFGSKTTNPNSRLYGPAASIAPLYGTDCSGFVSYCWGVQVKMGTSHFGGGYNGTYYCTALNVTNASTLGMLQVGDAFVRSGDHAILISEIQVDSNGNVTYLEVTEETPPKTKATSFTASAFVNKYLSGSNPYIAYRPKSYKVTFNGNGGTPSTHFMFVLANVPYSSGYGLPTATRDGFTFAGWYTAASGGTLVTNSSYSNAASRILYAHWIDNNLISGSGSCILPQTTTIDGKDEK